jgi:hypothetical protein
LSPIDHFDDPIDHLSMDYFRHLASKLSPSARNFLLRDEAELEHENVRTLEFISRFRFTNPLRFWHATAEKTVRVGSEPTRLLPEEREVAEALHFYFSGEYKSNGISVDRWIGPDGCIFIECSTNLRFLSVNFENGHRISMWPDVPDEVNERFPNTEFLISTPSFLDDYRRMLEAVAAYASKTSVRPLYRHKDPDLDLQCIDFYMRHLVDIKHVKSAASHRLWTIVGENLPVIDDFRMGESETRDIISSLYREARMTDHELVLACRSCGEKNHIPFAKVGPPTKCTGCFKQLGSNADVIPITSAIAFSRMIDEVQIPIVAVYWSPENWSSVMAAGFLHDAKQVNESFLAVLIDTTLLDETARSRGVSELPTLVCYFRGNEVARHVGSGLTIDGVHKLAQQP